ncbi:tetratricopeptide repeat protein [Amycolatopsis aidingensis]|uniref:tetratricopeptide repeat protein n=1 Tax=Amycolatopsis aidingensis TaxID=2842453 RepID=UPI001C0D411D|nr:hypothetical protein [Amycolatopsis aidingensis]
MPSPRRPNELLRLLIAEAGFTGDALVRAVNEVGAEAGLRLRYRRASVTQWVSGVRPRPPVPELLAEVLSRRLNRPITVQALGLGPAAGLDRHPLWGEDVGAQLVGLSESGASRDSGSIGYAYRLASLSVPGWSELTSAAAASTSTSPSAVGKIGQAEVRSAVAMARLFADADAAFGGGYGRIALASYLRSTITPWLRSDASPSTRRDLCAVAAKLTYLCGFMCFDDEFHGAAQRYYLISLRLAGDAGDVLGYACALRALSVQARMLGHFRQAVDLAEAAADAAADRVSRRVQAFLFGQCAVAEASAGDGQTALAHLGRTEAVLDRASSDHSVVGAYHHASFWHQHAAVRAHLGDRRAAAAALKSSIRRRPSAEHRSRAITLARLAELQLDGGQLELACSTWRRFLDDYPRLRSRRADRAVATLRARIRSHAGRPEVQALSRRVAELNAHDHS